MVTKAGSLGAFGGMHTAGIFSDMTVDGPTIGTLVVIMDRAKNLPNRRSMGKQDPYCAARLGKEAKKTTTDKRGGQTPRWDQELRFTVHDSPDYQNLKVSVFNDDKKTELIGETWVSLENVLLAGGGQSDGWHGLNCKGKYAGEIRIELTYYDNRPKTDKTPAEKRKESARPEAGNPTVGGPRESPAVKRRPLPSDPTGASPSPVATPEHRGPPAPQSGPRSYQTPPHQHRANEHTPTHQRRSHHPENQPPRRAAPDVSSLNGTPVSVHHTPQHQQEHDVYSASPNAPLPHASTPQYHGDGHDLAYAAPKPYEMQPLETLPQQPREHSHRAMSQDNFRSSHGHLPTHVEPPHSYSAPAVPTQSTDGYSHGYISQPESYSHMQDPYREPPYRIAPLRASRSNDRGFDQAPHEYHESSTSFDPFAAHGRPSGTMQPTVEDDDDIPPPPPVHRSSATTISQHPQERPPSYHSDAPAPLNISRFREDPPRTGYDSPPQPYGMNDYAPPASTERLPTHPRPLSRPVSRDTMAPSPLRNETAMIPSSLVPGLDPSRFDSHMSSRGDDHDSNPYQLASSYETPPRLRQHSEPDYRTPPQYETPPRPHPLAHQQSLPMAEPSSYYPHAGPDEPRQISPVRDHMPLVKPRATSPGNTQSPLDNRGSRTPVRSVPTRKSVSPRPPPSAIDSGEPGLSGVPFNPDSFDVYNPTVSKKPQSGTNNDSEDGHGRQIEVNDKGQVVTFNGRVIDASDHLPLDSWAPEPEPKVRPKDRPARERAVLSGARDIEGARQRERDYRKDRLEREKIRNAVDNIHGDSGSPSTALVTSRHRYSSSSGSPMNGGAMVLHDSESVSPGAGGRNRLQKRNPRPVSTYDAPAGSAPSSAMPSTGVLRERENPAGYGSSSYVSGTRHSVAAPPIPAKIPLENRESSEDMTALSLELQTIDIGPGSGGRHRATNRRRYDGY